PATGGARTFDHGPLPAGHPLNTSGEDLNLRYRFLDDPGYRVSDSSQYRALAGLRGSYNNWDWETALGVMGSRTKDRSRGGFFSVAGFTQVIGTPGYDENGNLLDPQFFNRGYRLGQLNSPEVINALFPENGYDGKITQQFIDAKISGQLGAIGGRPINWAFGGDLRHEKFLITPTANLLAGDIVSNGAASADASRNTGAAFAEVELPVTASMNVTGAARVDKFPGFNAHFSPKLAVRWEATPTLLLRGTLESGFRAPNLTESAQSSKFSFDNGTQDPARCPAAQAYARDLQAQSDALPASDPRKALLSAKADAVQGEECAGGVPNAVVNNPDLKPETSKSGTVGFVWEPARGYNLSVDYWNIKRKDEIATKTTDELLASEDSQPPGTITRLPREQDATFTSIEGTNRAALQAQYGVTKGPLAGLRGMFENVSKTKTSGIDVGGAARFQTGIGRLDLGLNATYLIELRKYFTNLNGGSYGDNLAGEYGWSRTKANFTAALQTGAWTNSLRFVWNSPTKLKQEYYDDIYTDEACEERGWSTCRVASYVRTDYNLSWVPIKNLTLSANIHNLFNRRPPLDLRSVDEGGGGVIPQDREDVMGRIFRLTMEYRF
ncbi:MAG: TonB-dependent receptor domain-containing protein, partial [Gammaproteobacteria bacterium]